MVVNLMASQATGCGWRYSRRCLPMTWTFTETTAGTRDYKQARAIRSATRLPMHPGICRWMTILAKHAPRSTCHVSQLITLEITGVRVGEVAGHQRGDALAEGINRIAHGREGYFYHVTRTEPHPRTGAFQDGAYRELWGGSTDRGMPTRGVRWSSRRRNNMREASKLRCEIFR